jgi:predicted nucleic acid-binding protein
MSTALDSNIVIDLFAISLGKVGDDLEWSEGEFDAAKLRGNVTICSVVFAEISPIFQTSKSAIDYLNAIGIDLPMNPSLEALFQAGRAHRDYRRNGGPRERTLPDFLIGADALDRGQVLITRDTARYATYFPTLQLIAPPQ